MPHLLLADDDRELSAMLREYLDREGFRVDVVTDGAAALERALAQDYDLIVLDVTMPAMNGFDVLRTLRARKLTPVLMLTARGDDVDSIVGLELGADDYLGKPCNVRVLEARIRAILRRAESRTESTGQILHQGDLTINSGDRTVRCAGKEVPLTSTEFSVLGVLMHEAGNVVGKSELSTQALGRDLGRFDRSLDMHVSNLRQKLGPLADGTERIKTVRGVGYQYILA
jgi:DNA-binding response OmpR family regulator